MSLSCTEALRAYYTARRKVETEVGPFWRAYVAPDALEKRVPAELALLCLDQQTRESDRILLRTFWFLRRGVLFGLEDRLFTLFGRLSLRLLWSPEVVTRTHTRDIDLTSGVRS